MTFKNFSPYCLESVAAETRFMVTQQTPSSCTYIMRLHVIQHEINFYNKILKCFIFLLRYLQVRIFSHKKLKIWHALLCVHIFKNMHI